MEGLNILDFAKHVNNGPKWDWAQCIAICLNRPVPRPDGYKWSKVLGPMCANAKTGYDEVTGASYQVQGTRTW